MQTPKFLQELISSPEYGDKNSETYKRATKYMNILYPGTVQFDATGRMMHPEYDMKFEQAYNKLKEPEGEYTDGKNQRKDEPTNMGIKQSTLDRYASKHSDKNFPADVKYLTAAQPKQIYKNEYGQNTRNP